jgi:hypothetical protein
MAPFMGTTNTFRHHIISRITDGQVKHIGKQSSGTIDMTTYLRVAKNKRGGKAFALCMALCTAIACPAQNYKLGL